MCKSKCSGACMTMLKAKLINSGESGTEINNLLNKITACGAPTGTDKIAFMNDVTNLKVEANHLLDEVNQYAEIFPNGKRISNSPYDFESIFEEHSFKQRLNDLKQKINALSLENIALQ